MHTIIFKPSSYSRRFERNFDSKTVRKHTRLQTSQTTLNNFTKPIDRSNCRYSYRWMMHFCNRIVHECYRFYLFHLQMRFFPSAHERDRWLSFCAAFGFNDHFNCCLAFYSLDTCFWYRLSAYYAMEIYLASVLSRFKQNTKTKKYVRVGALSQYTESVGFSVAMNIRHESFLGIPATQIKYELLYTTGSLFRTIDFVSMTIWIWLNLNIK